MLSTGYFYRMYLFKKIPSLLYSLLVAFLTRWHAIWRCSTRESNVLLVKLNSTPKQCNAVKDVEESRPMNESITNYKMFMCPGWTFWACFQAILQWVNIEYLKASTRILDAYNHNIVYTCILLHCPSGKMASFTIWFWVFVFQLEQNVFSEYRIGLIICKHQAPKEYIDQLPSIDFLFVIILLIIPIFFVTFPRVFHTL